MTRRTTTPEATNENVTIRTHSSIAEEEPVTKAKTDPKAGDMPGGVGHGSPRNGRGHRALDQAAEDKKDRVRRAARSVGKVGFGSLRSKRNGS